MDGSIKLKQPRKQNAFEAAGLFSQLFYAWSVPFLLSGFKRELTDEDIREPMNRHKSDRCEREGRRAWTDELNRAKRANRRPSLARALIGKYGPRYLTMCLLLLIVEVCSFLQVYFIFGLLSYFSGIQSTDYDAVHCAGGVIALGFVRVILVHTVHMRSPFIGISMSVAASTLIYRKVLNLRKAKESKMSTGFILNLFASDAKKLEGLFFMPFYLILSPLQCLMAGYFNWRLIGYAALPGAAFSVCYYPVQWWLAGKTSFLRHQAAEKSDARVRLMNEIISGIKVIKMYAWEAPFAKLVSAARKDELKTIRRALAYKEAAMVSFIYQNRVALFITLMCYKLIDGRIDAVTVYAVTALINIYQASLSLVVTKSAVHVGEALISLGRMTDFLLSGDNYEEDKKKHNKLGKDEEIVMNLNPPSSILPGTDYGEISVSSLNACWSDDSEEPTLSDIDIAFPKGELSAIVGPVGSGKSSLLSAIIRELPIKSGLIRVPQRLSYAAQEPWVFQGTIIENIVFGQTMDDERYKIVLKVCGLDRDVASFPNGDRTIVGERGVMLSGGQKARVGLARAVYRKADAYLLDDPLSAVDVNVGKLIFEQCIKGLLRRETVILVTHQIQFLDSVEKIVCLENGKIKSVLTYTNLQEGQYHFSKKNDEDIEDSLAEDLGETHNTTGCINKQNKIDEMPPENTLVKPVENVYAAYFKVNGGYWIAALVIFVLLISQILRNFFDVWLKQWVQVEEAIQSKSNVSHRLSNMDAPNVTWTPPIDSVTEIYMIVMTVSIGSLVISALCFAFGHVYFCVKVSKSLHNDMNNAVMRTSMYFFNNSTSGRILNRFSTELRIIDEILSGLGMTYIVLGFSLMGSILVVSIINPWMIITFFFIVLICMGLREIYIRTSRSFKRIESTSRSPLLAHVNQTVEGLKTIRVFGGQDFFTSEFYRHHDFYTAASFSTHACGRAFGFWIDIMGSVMTAAVIAGTFMMEGFAGDAGLVMTQVIATSGLLQLLLRTGVDFENAMSSVERVAEYAGLPSEDNRETAVPSGAHPLETWPREGKIHFDNVSFRYRHDGPRVLDSLNFTIMPREKIGIIGRTGAGKSSLIQALFRLAEVEGKLEIDDVDTATIPLHTLRSRISIIPQDPLLFLGTLRKNLDPFDSYKDDELWNALEEVELKEVVTRMPSGLNAEISEGGGNLSAGQKQLVCLARAFIRNNKILVLDEATANVDNETDAMIQKTIRRKFRANTVLTIAHRLHTVMDSDRVLVLSDGNVVEFDHPHVLFQDPNGHLTSLLQKCNRSTVTTLRTLAEESYKKKLQGGTDQ